MRPLFFADHQPFWYETLRSFGHIAYGGADFGEVAVTAERITTGDYDSWYEQWTRTADTVAAGAERALAAGHAVTARDGYLRASNYYRTAEFFLHANPAEPRMAAAHDRAVACFTSAAPLLDIPAEPVRIPYEGTELPGYFYRARTGPNPGPAVVMHNGFDGSAEEMHFVAAAGLAERGYHVLSFDGPGQPGPMHAEGLLLRPDWEKVVSRVLDHLLTRAEVDGARIALLGNSMGGLLAPRAAAFEPRLAALVALDGVQDMSARVVDMFGGDRTRTAAMLRASAAPDIDAAIAEAAAADPTMRWAIEHGMWVTGTTSPRAYLAAMLDYRVDDDIAGRITCPTLVCAADDDHFFRGQPEALHDRLRCPKTLLRFTDELGAGAHCHAGAQRHALGRVGDWLDHVLHTH